LQVAFSRRFLFHKISGVLHLRFLQDQPGKVHRLVNQLANSHGVAEFQSLQPGREDDGCCQSEHVHIAFCKLVYRAASRSSRPAFRRAAPAIGAAPALRPASFIGGLFRSTFAVSHFGDWSMGPKLSTSYERYSAPSALLGRDQFAAPFGIPHPFAPTAARCYDFCLFNR